METRRYRITENADGSRAVTSSPVGLGFAGTICLLTAVFFGLGGIVALFAAQWGALGVCLLLCGIFLPNFAKRQKMGL